MVKRAGLENPSPQGLRRFETCPHRKCMKIRQATQADKDAVFELLIELKRSGYEEMGVDFEAISVTDKVDELYADFIGKPGSYLLVAEDKGVIVGICVAYEVPKIIEGRMRMVIEEMVVKPDIRGTGIGSKLIEEIETIAKRRGIVHIKVTTGTRLKANSFYQRHGYALFENAYRKDLRKG